MRFPVVVCGLALALSACTTTVSRDEAFSAGAGQSYVVIAGEGMPTEGVETHDYKFQRVDMASSKFLREYVYVRFGDTQVSGGGNEFEKPQTMAGTSIRYAGRKLAPGDYALVSHHRLKSLGTMSMRNINCYSRGAVIYRFREGAINIVRLARGYDVAGFVSGAASVVDVTDPAALQAQVAEVLAGYPEMNAPTAVAKLLGTATFETGANNCTTSGSFSFNRAPGVSVDW